MHKTRRMARNLAWSDPSNPFHKTHTRRESDLARDMEKGYPQTNPEPTPEHSDLKNPRWEGQATSPAQPQRVDTFSHLQGNNADEHLGITSSSTTAYSPPRFPSESQQRSTPNEDSKEYVEKDTTTVNGNYNSELEQSDDKADKKRTLRGLFQGRKTDRVESMRDDNNGKNKKPKPKFTFMSQLRATLFNSWINVLLIASPIGIALNYAHVNDVAIFVVNFIAIIPLAAMLSYATEEIALRTGEVIGGLLNASFGNAVELIVSVIALANDQILIVQTSLIGSMLSNLLLVMGMCFFAGGINRMEQAFNMTVAQTAASLLFLAVASLLIPTAFAEWAATGTTPTTSTGAPDVPGIAELSRATAILLLLVYGAYLFFQLKSHAKMYSAPSEKNEKRDFSKQKEKMKSVIPDKIRRSSAEPPSPTESAEEEDEREEPKLHIWVAIATLAASTALVALNAEYLVDSIDAITCDGSISKNFVGLILLPIVGNAAEHATAVTVAIKDKMDLAIGVAVGSSMQIALLVLPFVVVLGWIIGKDDMTLYFDGFQIAVLFVAVLLVNYLIQDGKSHWLEGVLLMTLYIIIAVAAWFYPTAPGLSDCPAT